MRAPSRPQMSQTMKSSLLLAVFQDSSNTRLSLYSVPSLGPAGNEILWRGNGVVVHLDQRRRHGKIRALTKFTQEPADVFGVRVLMIDDLAEEVSFCSPLVWRQCVELKSFQ